jgi:hypothetical protein
MFRLFQAKWNKIDNLDLKIHTLLYLIVLFIEIFFSIYIIDKLTYRNSPSKHSCLCNLWTVSESISNKYINGIIDEQSVLKKFYLFYSVGIFIGKYNISLT